MTIEEFWRSPQTPEFADSLCIKHFDITDCTLLLELEGDLLIGMKDGTILAITGQSSLKEVEKSAYGSMVKCPVPMPVNATFNGLSFPNSNVFETDQAYFKVLGIGMLREAFAFVPKVGRWFIDTTRKLT